MNYLIRKILCCLLCVVLTVSAQAETVKVKGQVMDVMIFASNYQSYSSSDVGLANIYIDSPEMKSPCESGATSGRIAISADHPLFDSVVSMAFIAKTTGKKVEMWHTGTCTLRSSSWDFALIKFAE